jgi:hypothetical protein
MTTPAEAAKTYAARNGFTITPNGRRYTVTHAASGTTFERGGYAAVLNEMQVMVGTLGFCNVGCEHAMAPAVATGAVLDELAKIPTAPIDPNCRVLGLDIGAPEGDQTAFTLRSTEQICEDLIDGAQMMGIGLRTVSEMINDAPAFDVFSAVAHERIRKQAASIRAAEHKPYLISRMLNGKRVDMSSKRYRTRDEAIRDVRRLFNAGAMYRTAALQVEYRP